MVSDGYQLCRKPGSRLISITLPALGSDGIKIGAQIFRFDTFSCSEDGSKKKRRGFPRRFNR
jgi:hypothetical protein